MDESAVKKIVEANIEQLKKQLGLTDWGISTTYGSCDGDPAVTMCDIDYKIADIRLDPMCMDDEAEVLHALKHELMHCVISSFQTYRSAVECFLTEKERAAMAVIFRRADEESACALAKILERIESED